jgi:putative endonuclease
VPGSYRVYVLQNPAGRFYIGFSENMTLRIQQHNTGLTRSTRSKGPWELAWQSDALALADARKLELDLKRQKGGNGFYQKTGDCTVLEVAPRRGGVAPRNQSFPRVEKSVFLRENFAFYNPGVSPRSKPLEEVI